MAPGTDWPARGAAASRYVRWLAFAGLWLAVGVAAGCTALPTGPGAPRPVVAVDLDVKRIPLPRDPTQKDVKPLVEASINGVQALMVVDTGSSQHILTKSFVKRAQLDLAEGYHAGHIDIALAGSTIKAEGFVVTDAIAEFDSEGWGGVLSPQRLIKDGYTVIDFPGRRLLAFDPQGRSGAFAYVARRYPDASLLEFRWNGAEFFTFLIPGRVRGSSEVTVLDVDSGTSESLVPPRALPDGTALQDGARFKSIDGQVTTTKQTGPLTILLDALEIDLAAVRVATRAGELPSGDRWEGSLGMDALESMVLLIPPNTERRFWILQVKRPLPGR